MTRSQRMFVGYVARFNPDCMKRHFDDVRQEAMLFDGDGDPSTEAVRFMNRYGYRYRPRRGDRLGKRRWIRPEYLGSELPMVSADGHETNPIELAEKTGRIL